ncbi:hypothetical protein ACL90Y_05310 [Micrococcus luteus]
MSDRSPMPAESHPHRGGRDRARAIGRQRSHGGPAEVLVVAGVHAAPRRRQAAEFAWQPHSRLVPAEDWGEDGLVPASALAGGPGTVVLEVPAQVPVTHVIGELADEKGRVRLRAVVAVACLHTLHADLASDRSRALVDCLETATHHALVGDGACAGDVAQARRILQALRPGALGVEGLHAGAAADGTWTAEPEADAGVGAEIDCAGWLRVLNGEWPEDRHDPGVAVARYERLRPFHRGRLEDLAARWECGQAVPTAMPQGVRTGLRISGLCRIADRPEWTFRWDQVGTNLELHPLAPDSAVVGAETSDGLESELLCLGPELALFGWGDDVDLAPVVADLDAALLTDAEFAAGPEAWG